MVSKGLGRRKKKKKKENRQKQSRHAEESNSMLLYTNVQVLSFSYGEKKKKELWS